MDKESAASTSGRSALPYTKASFLSEWGAMQEVVGSNQHRSLETTLTR